MKIPHSHTNVAVFDISSSSVSGAHITLYPPIKNKEGGMISPPLVVNGAIRKHSELKEDITIERFLEQTILQLSKTIEFLQKKAKVNPSYIQVLLASPWFVCQTRTIVYTKTADFVCTNKLVNDLIEKEIAYVMTHDMERFGSFGKQSTIIEKQISKIKLNGYNIEEPFGKKTQSLEISFVITLSPKIIIKKFKDELYRKYGVKKIGFTTSPFATHIVTRDYLNAPEDSLIIDIGEEITDIAFIKYNLFVYHHSFPIGGYEFYRSLESKNIAGIAEAEGLLETYKKGKMSDSQKRFIEDALGDYAKKWQRSLQEIVDTAGFKYLLPKNIYITGDARFNIFFEEMLKTDPLLTHKAVSKEISPNFITKELLLKYISTPDNSFELDESILIGGLFVQKLL